MLRLRRLEVLGHNLPVKSITPKCITRDAQTMHLGVITQSEHDQGLPKAPAEKAIQCRFSPLPVNLKYLTSISKSESFLPIHFLCTDVIPCSRLRCYLILVSYARSSPCPSRAKFIKNIIRNKRPYIRISVPLFQHRLKCKLKKDHTICISGFSTFCRNVEFS